jgi:hypothetical protein
MRTYLTRFTWMVCLLVLLTACKRQPEVSPPTNIPATNQVARSPTSQVAKSVKPTPTQTVVSAVTAVQAETDIPSPTTTRPAQNTANPTRRVPSKTPLPSPTDLSTIAPPSGEIAYFNLRTMLMLKELKPGGMTSTLYTKGHLRVPEREQGVSWTPDGKKVAFGMGMTNLATDIYLLTVGLNDETNLTRTDDTIEMEPAISPNGKLIAFISDRREVDEGIRDLYTMRLDGSNIQLLLMCEQPCDQPEWSPDGKQLVLQMGNDLYLLPANGGKPIELISGAINQFPTWSPDGQWIAFVRSQSVSYGYPSYIYLVKPDGTGLQALTGDGYFPRRLSWSPDSQYIAFEDWQNMVEKQGIRAVHVQSGDVFDLMTGPGFSPAWRPVDLSKQPTSTATSISALTDCSNGWTRLKVGEQARVTGKPGDPPNRVRDNPSLSATQIGSLEPGTMVEILEGPVCADGLVWWKVSEDEWYGGGVAGWTAEGDGKEYWLEPQE